MNDKELYRQLLGLSEPWVVSEVNVDFTALLVEIKVDWPRQKKAACPECAKQCSIYDHREQRSWRHLDTMQFKTVLTCKIPRINCEEHGVKTIKVPWAEEHSRFTALFERLAIDVLLSAQNQVKAKELLNLSWDEIHRVQERAVNRGLSCREEEIAKHIGIDEKSFLKGQSYATLLYDLDNAKVLDVVKDRKEESLEKMLNKMTDDQCKGIEAIAIDMWAPFINIAEKILPQADIVHDKFHIAGYLSKAVDKVRQQEHKLLQRQGSKVLSGTKYLWLSSKNNWSSKQRAAFKELRNNELKVGRAGLLRRCLAGSGDIHMRAQLVSFFVSGSTGQLILNLNR